MAVIEQYPYTDSNGKANNKLVKHYSDSGKTLIQLETGREYEEAVDKYPCPFTYAEKDEDKTSTESASMELDDETDGSGTIGA